MADATSSNSAQIIRGTFEDCLMAMAQIDVLKEQIKGNVDSLHEQFDLDKKVIRAALKCLHNPDGGGINDMEAHTRKVREYLDAFSGTASPISVTSEEGTGEDVEFDGELEE